jgi:hypothetical protein
MRHEGEKNIPGRILFVVLVLALFLLTPECRAANHFVRAGAAGSGSGVDWTNAFTDLPNSLVRGDIYYVAAGTYKPHFFNDADSGTSIIEIRAATVADHGTSTGWSDSFAGQATFASGSATPDGAIFEFGTDYYLINGQVRGSDWQSGYGLHVSDTNKNAPESVVLIGNRNPGFAHDINLSFVDVEGSHNQDDSFNEQGVEALNGSFNLTFQSSYIHDLGNTNFMLRGPALQTGMGTGNNIMIQNNWIARDFSDPNHHGEACSCSEGLKNFTIRYNYFEDIEGTAFVATPSGLSFNTGNTGNGPWNIYGNVFFFQTARTGCGVGSAFQFFDVTFTGDLNIYNNSFANINSTICPSNGSAGFLIQGGSNPANLQGLNVQNNLWFNGDAFVADNTCSTCASVTWSNNAYFSTNVTDSDGAKQVGSGNPFVGSATNNFRLASATVAGATLLAPFNTDVDGTTRGVDGVWDRGAFEFDSGKRPPLPPPKVTLVVH